METQLNLPLFSNKAKKQPSLGSPTKKSVNNIRNLFRKANIVKKKALKNTKKWFFQRRQDAKRSAAEKDIEDTKKAEEQIQNPKSKKQGTGFFGNIMNFLAIVIGGWVFNNLPIIIEKAKAFIETIKPVVEVLKGFVKGVVGFFTWIFDKVTIGWNHITGNTEEAKAKDAEISKKLDELQGTWKKQDKGFDELKSKAKEGEKVAKKSGEEAIKEEEKQLAETQTDSSGAPVSSTPTSAKSSLKEYTQAGLDALIKSGASSRKIRFYKNMLYHKKPHLKPVHATTDFAGNVLSKEQEAAALKDPHFQEAGRSLSSTSTRTVTTTFTMKSNKGDVTKLQKVKKSRVITVPIQKQSPPPSAGGGSGATTSTSGIPSRKTELNSKDLILSNIQ